jgi:hypothetical protein
MFIVPFPWIRPTALHQRCGQAWASRSVRIPFFDGYPNMIATHVKFEQRGAKILSDTANRNRQK